MGNPKRLCMNEFLDRIENDPTLTDEERHRIRMNALTSAIDERQRQIDEMMRAQERSWEDEIGFWTPEAVDQRFLAKIEHDLEMRGELPPDLFFADGPDAGDMVE
jgi:hypothetical protein